MPDRSRVPVAPSKLAAPRPTSTDRAVDGAMLAYEVDPTPENEATLREAMRAAGSPPGEIDRALASLRGE